MSYWLINACYLQSGDSLGSNTAEPGPSRLSCPQRRMPSACPAGKDMFRASANSPESLGPRPILPLSGRPIWPRGGGSNFKGHQAARVSRRRVCPVSARGARSQRILPAPAFSATFTENRLVRGFAGESPSPSTGRGQRHHCPMWASEVSPNLAVAGQDVAVGTLYESEKCPWAECHREAAAATLIPLVEG